MRWQCPVTKACAKYTSRIKSRVSFPAAESREKPVKRTSWKKSNRSRQHDKYFLILFHNLTFTEQLAVFPKSINFLSSWIYFHCRQTPPSVTTRTSVHQPQARQASPNCFYFPKQMLELKFQDFFFIFQNRCWSWQDGSLSRNLLHLHLPPSLHPHPPRHHWEWVTCWMLIPIFYLR